MASINVQSWTLPVASSANGKPHDANGKPRDYFCIVDEKFVIGPNERKHQPDPTPRAGRCLPQLG